MNKNKEKIFNIIQIGTRDNALSVFFDAFIVVVIFLNLFVTLYSTYDSSVQYAHRLYVIELVTVIIFTVEYILRLWTADYLYPGMSAVGSRAKFVFSFYGLIDLLTFLPFYLPIVFPAGAVAFRLLRVIRIFRLFKINSKYDAFNVITNVLKEKKNQLFSSICMILILMVASSLCMYSVEHEAQPEAFRNAFSGIWWSASTLLTVGYGDIYPVTTLGKLFAIVISFLGVGMVAIPTGIISAGFVEQYSLFKRMELNAEERDYHFVTSVVQHGHSWDGKKVREITFPPELLLVLIIRGNEKIVPRGETKIFSGDTLVIGAKHYALPAEVEFKEILIKSQSEWVNKKIKELDISRLSMIVMIQRKGKVVVPNGDTIIHVGDKVIMYK